MPRCRVLPLISQPAACKPSTILCALAESVRRSSTVFAGPDCWSVLGRAYFRSKYCLSNNEIDGEGQTIVISGNFLPAFRSTPAWTC